MGEAAFAGGFRLQADARCIIDALRSVLRAFILELEGPILAEARKPISRPSRPARRWPLVVGALAVAAIGVGAAAFAMQLAADEPLAQTGSQDGRVTLIAVGDNLTDATLGAYADACAGEAGDGDYDYRPLYEEVKPYIEGADLAYVCQELHLDDELGPKGYPSFNVTSQMADALVDTGFDLVAGASNHCYDWASFGAAEHSRQTFDESPLAYTGTANSQEQADELVVVERNGIRFAFLAYTYGVNGYAADELPPYAVNIMDEDRIRADVQRAREEADVVLVAMHWGTENTHEPDAQQQEYAQLLADLEVDVVLGSHPHVIQPLEWVEGANGNRTLVAYSMGNFISYHDFPGFKNELGGMLGCTFVRDGDDVHVEDVQWWPLVNHTEGGQYRVYTLSDYTVKLAERNEVLSGVHLPLEALRSLDREVMGKEFRIND